MNGDLLIDKLLQSKKYGDVCPDTVRRVVAECEGRYKKAKDLEKAVREKLHGITGAFNELGPKTAQDVAQLGNDDALFESILTRHASTRERLPLAAMDEMYARLFQQTGAPKSILDLACGLNPVYLIHRYPSAGPIVGVDISKSCVSLIGEMGRNDGSEGVCADLLCEGAIPNQHFHIALLFKILPLLERQRPGAALDVMNAIHADFLVVSFPTRTLGGRNVGMENNYAVWMEAHLPKNRKIADRFTTDNELFYILKEN